MKNLILKLHEIGAVKFGSFTLKSGIVSPIYIDLRVIISYPQVLKGIADALWEKTNSLSYDLVCGVPYTALPIATAFSLKYDVPMVMRRKEAKDYGLKKMIEGVFQKGQQCLILEDLITSGASILETLEPLEKEGLIVKDVAVIINREQGGEARLNEKGLTLHSLFSLKDLLQTLRQADKISEEIYEQSVLSTTR